ncbi:MAG: UMP kinase [Methanobacteriota archaeon]|nr:MAG: UMP kinase [Euryarchaeota archaeon]
MDTVVISIGGSVLVPGENDSKYISKLGELLTDLSSRLKIYSVVGGGKTARFYIRLGRELGADESFLDEMGVQATRLNARLLISSLSGKANDHPPETVEEAFELGKSHEIVVMGGTTPGHTTDGVAASLAESVKADRIINATSVDGVYTKDPKKHEDAEKLDSLSFEDLLNLTQTSSWKAGPSNVFDSMGSEILARARIPLLVVNGRDLTNLAAAIKGEEFSGTIVGGED